MVSMKSLTRKLRKLRKHNCLDPAVLYNINLYYTVVFYIILYYTRLYHIRGPKRPPNPIVIMKYKPTKRLITPATDGPQRSFGPIRWKVKTIEDETLKINGCTRTRSLQGSHFGPQMVPRGAKQETCRVMYTRKDGHLFRSLTQLKHTPKKMAKVTLG